VIPEPTNNQERMAFCRATDQTVHDGLCLGVTLEEIIYALVKQKQELIRLLVDTELRNQTIHRIKLDQP